MIEIDTTIAVVEPPHFFEELDERLNLDDLSALGQLIDAFLQLRDRYDADSDRAKAQALYEQLTKRVTWVAQDFGIQKQAIAEYIAQSTINRL